MNAGRPGAGPAPALLLAGVLAAAGSGCDALQRAGSSSSRQVDALRVEALLREAARPAPVTLILVAPGVSDGIVREAGRRRPMRRVPSRAIDGLGAGQLLLQADSNARGNATLSGHVGPVPKARPGEGLLACGTGLTVTFEWRGGAWREGELQTLQC